MTGLEESFEKLWPHMAKQICMPEGEKLQADVKLWVKASFMAGCEYAFTALQEVETLLKQDID